jgi:DNA-binding transcriptional ArsR family regulator
VLTDMLNPAKRPYAPEQPQMRLAQLGFSAAEQLTLRAVLGQRAVRGRIEWHVAQPGEADAWFVNGSRVQRLPDGTLRIMPGVASGRAIRIHAEELDWPMAFSLPVGTADFKPSYSFELGSSASIEAVLDQVENWARPLMIQFYLASYMEQSGLELRSSVYHVSVRGKLMAVVNPRKDVGVWALADPAWTKHAVWSRRPESADAIPATFVRIGFPELMWQYAVRTTRDCLPSQYRSRTLFLRRPPKVAMRLMTDTCLLLVRELGTMPGTLGELSQRTGITQPKLSRHLAAMYLVGAITSDPDRAGRTQLAQARSEISDWHLSAPADLGPGSATDNLTVRLLGAGRPVR